MKTKKLEKSNNKDMNSYVLIVIPNKRVSDFVDKYRKKYAKYTGYTIPSHATIYPPFFIKNSDEKKIIESLNTEFSGTNSKTVFLQSIDSFTNNNNVVFFGFDQKSNLYIKSLVINAIKSLQDKVASIYGDYNFAPEKFTPHVTIAERIPDNIFSKMKKELSGFKDNISFEITSVFLYKQEGNSKIWNELKKIKF